jgi:glucosamine-6-phosphate deaminase
MGVGTILDSRELMLLAAGSPKAGVVAAAIEGPVSSRISASAIQFHPSCKVVLDDEAAAELEDLDYYKFIFHNEEKWDSLRHFVFPSAR